MKERLCSRRMDGVEVVGLEGGKLISSCSCAPVKCRRPELRIVEVGYPNKKTGEIPKRV